MKELIKNLLERFVFFDKRETVKITLFRYDIGKNSKYEEKLKKKSFRKGDITAAAIIAILYLVTVVSCIVEGR